MSKITKDNLLSILLSCNVMDLLHIKASLDCKSLDPNFKLNIVRDILKAPCNELEEVLWDELGWKFGIEE